MKRAELIFSTILPPLDYIMLVLTGILIYDLRQEEIFTDIQPLFYDIYSLGFGVYLKWIMLISILFILIFAFLGLYQIHSTKKFWPDATNVFVGISTGFSFIVFAAFLDQSIIAPRFFVIAGWLVGMILVLTARFLIKAIQRYLLVSQEIGVHKLLIVGSNDKLTDEFIESVEDHPQSGYKISKIVKRITQDRLEKIYQKEKIDEIILTDPYKPEKQINALVNFADEHKITYKYIPSDLEAKIGKIKTRTLLNFPMIEIQRTPLEGWGHIAKRTIDIIGSILGLILLSPLLLITTLLVKITSKGPALADIPPRAGQNGTPFRCLKFRSMYVGAHKDQEKLSSDRKGIFKLKNDPRITAVGKFIRRTSIDELPQLINVLRGEMSLVGPRPHFLNEYQKEHKKVWTIKPGITGLPQTSGRSDLTFEEEVKLDTYYIENWNLILDLFILTKTIFVLFRNREAE